MAGVIEAMSAGQRAGDISILSLGTANVFLPLRRPGGHGPDYLFAIPKKSGPLTDIGKLAGAILGDPPDTASFMAHIVLGGGVSSDEVRSPIVRLNPLIQPVPTASGQWALPQLRHNHLPRWGAFPDNVGPEAQALSPDDFQALVAMDMDATDQDDVNLIVRFASRWMENHIPNQPVRAGEGLECQIGQRWFYEGWGRAAALFGALRPPAPAETQVA